MLARNYCCGHMKMFSKRSTQPKRISPRLGMGLKWRAVQPELEFSLESIKWLGWLGWMTRMARLNFITWNVDEHWNELTTSQILEGVGESACRHAATTDPPSFWSLRYCCLTQIPRNNSNARSWNASPAALSRVELLVSHETWPPLLLAQHQNCGYSATSKGTTLDVPYGKHQKGPALDKQYGPNDGRFIGYLYANTAPTVLAMFGECALLWTRRRKNHEV